MTGGLPEQRPEPFARVRSLLRGGYRPLWAACLGVLLALCLGGPAQGQGALLGADPALQVVRFGAGGVSRAGDWTGVLVEFTDTAQEPREVVLRLVLEDPDGDEILHDRAVAANPGVPQRFWLYARLPFDADPGTGFRVAAFEAVEGSGGEPGSELLRFRAGRLIASTDVHPRGLVAPDISLIGVVGSSSMGLEGYAADGGRGYAPLGHELSRVVFDLPASDLPDRWQGLVQFGTLVWGETSRAYDPTRLTPDQATAIRRWVERGGHLVVVLPSAGQEWTGAAANPLLGLLPPVAIRRDESVATDPIRGLLTGDPDAPVPDRLTVQTFETRAQADRLDAMPILTLPDGRAVAVRRSVGAGLVTLVGLDLADRRLRNAGLPEADAFWHRVLGRRGEVMTESEIARRAQQGGGGGIVQQRETMDFDLGINRVINKTATASLGVTLGFIVFVAYWLAAGPLGYAVLSKYGLRRHAWAWFAAAAAIFTGVAWSGATALRPRRANASMLAIVDQVHGQTLLRARAWATVLLPEYGEALVEVGPEAAAPGQTRGDLLAPWHPAGGVLRRGFPDNRDYRVDCRDPDALVVPTRSTVKQFRIDWAGEAVGAADAAEDGGAGGHVGGWGMPRPIGLVGDAGPAMIRYHAPQSFPEGAARHLLSGELIHDLPAALTDVTILVSTGQRPIGRGGTGVQPVSNVYAIRPAGDWAPGARLDLRQLTTYERAGELTERLADGLFQRLLRAGESAVAVDARGDLEDQLLGLTFFNHLEPPDPRTAAASTRTFPRARRVDTHGYDLDAWLAQPCVIVVGVLRTSAGSGSPAPLFVDGRAVPTDATTLVRWICPLDPAPPAYAGQTP